MKEYCLQYEDNEKEITTITFDYIKHSIGIKTSFFEFFYKGRLISTISFSDKFNDNYITKNSNEGLWR